MPSKKLLLPGSCPTCGTYIGPPSACRVYKSYDISDEEKRCIMNGRKNSGKSSTRNKDTDENSDSTLDESLSKDKMKKSKNIKSCKFIKHSDENDFSNDDAKKTRDKYYLRKTENHKMAHCSRRHPEGVDEDHDNFAKTKFKVINTENNKRYKVADISSNNIAKKAKLDEIIVISDSSESHNKTINSKELEDISEVDMTNAVSNISSQKLMISKKSTPNRPLDLLNVDVKNIQDETFDLSLSSKLNSVITPDLLPYSEKVDEIIVITSDSDEDTRDHQSEKLLTTQTVNKVNENLPVIEIMSSSNEELTILEKLKKYAKGITVSKSSTEQVTKNAEEIIANKETVVTNNEEPVSEETSAERPILEQNTNPEIQIPVAQSDVQYAEMNLKDEDKLLINFFRSNKKYLDKRNGIQIYNFFKHLYPNTSPAEVLRFKFVHRIFPNILKYRLISEEMIKIYEAAEAHLAGATNDVGTNIQEHEITRATMNLMYSQITIKDEHHLFVVNTDEYFSYDNLPKVKSENMHQLSFERFCLIDYVDNSRKRVFQQYNGVMAEFLQNNCRNFENNTIQEMVNDLERCCQLLSANEEASSDPSVVEDFNTTLEETFNGEVSITISEESKAETANEKGGNKTSEETSNVEVNITTSEETANEEDSYTISDQSKAETANKEGSNTTLADSKEETANTDENEISISGINEEINAENVVSKDNSAPIKIESQIDIEEMESSNRIYDSKLIKETKDINLANHSGLFKKTALEDIQKSFNNLYISIPKKEKYDTKSTSSSSKNEPELVTVPNESSNKMVSDIKELTIREENYSPKKYSTLPENESQSVQKQNESSIVSSENDSGTQTKQNVSLNQSSEFKIDSQDSVNTQNFIPRVSSTPKRHASQPISKEDVSIYQNIYSLPLKVEINPETATICPNSETSTATKASAEIPFQPKLKIQLPFNYENTAAEISKSFGIKSESGEMNTIKEIFKEMKEEIRISESGEDAGNSGDAGNNSQFLDGVPPTQQIVRSVVSKLNEEDDSTELFLTAETDSLTSQNQTDN